jgi:hypothetical protein
MSNNFNYFLIKEQQLIAQEIQKNFLSKTDELKPVSQIEIHSINANLLLTTIILGDEGNSLGRSLGIPYLNTGWMAILIMPIVGFLIIVFSRFLAEQIKALSAIANNTKK